MADVKISALTAVAAASDAQELAVNDAGTSKKVTVAQVKADVPRIVANMKLEGWTGNNAGLVPLYASAPAALYRVSVCGVRLTLGAFYQFTAAFGWDGNPDSTTGNALVGSVALVVNGPSPAFLNLQDSPVDSASFVFYHDGTGDISFYLPVSGSCIAGGDDFYITLEKFPTATVSSPDNPVCGGD